MEKKKGSVSFLTVLTLTGAVISYRVGAAFASGNECIQIFGSWGEDVGWAVLGAAVTVILGSIGVYLISYEYQFHGSEEAYRKVGGKRFGKFIQIFTGLCLLFNFFTMFAGAGSLLNQHLGLPNWVGASLVGIVTFISLLGGLKSLEKILGSIGIVILVYLVVFGSITLVNVKPDLDTIYGAKDAVAAGQIMQVNLFSLPPFSLIPGLAEHNNALVNGVVYGAEATFCSFPFMIMLAKRCKTKREAVVSAAAGDIGFMFCVCVSLIVLMFNFDSIINPITFEMHEFPILAAVEKLWSAVSWTYAIICFAGVFTTVSGYLYAVDEIVFKEAVTSRKSKMFQIAMIIVGILLGGLLPFSKLINVLLPIRGVVGFLLIILVFILVARLEKKAATERYNRKESTVCISKNKEDEYYQERCTMTTHRNW